MINPVTSSYGSSEIARSLQLEQQQQRQQVRESGEAAATASQQQAAASQQSNNVTTQAVQQNSETSANGSATRSQPNRELEDRLQSQLINARAAARNEAAPQAAAEQDSQSTATGAGDQAQRAADAQRQQQQQDSNRAELNAYSQQQAVVQYQSTQSLLQPADNSGTVRASA